MCSRTTVDKTTPIQALLHVSVSQAKCPASEVLDGVTSILARDAYRASGTSFPQDFVSEPSKVSSSLLRYRLFLPGLFLLSNGSLLAAGDFDSGPGGGGSLRTEIRLKT